MKSRTKYIIWSVVTTLLILIAIPAAVIALGAVNIAATEAPGLVETNVATWTLNRSVDVRAPAEANPLGDDADAVSAGLQGFGAMCLQCHGAPQVEPEEFAKGLNPAAPELSIVLDEWSDGELFWIVKHGIRMTGMPAFGPTHSDDDIWKIVAFVRKLPNLTEEEREQLSSASASGHSGGFGTGHHDSGESAQSRQTPSHHQDDEEEDHSHEESSL